MWALIGVLGLSVTPGWPGAHALGPPLLVAQADAEAPAEPAAEAAAEPVAETPAEPVPEEAPAEPEAEAPVEAVDEVPDDPEAAPETTDTAVVAEEIKATEVSAEEPAAEAAAEAGHEDGAWVLQKTRELTSTGDDERPWHVSGGLTYRGLVIVDEDAANDQNFSWSLRGDYDVFEGGRAWIRLGLTQNFVAEGDPEEGGESGFLFQDASLGFDYGHEVGLDFVPLESFKGKKLDFEHRLGLFLPTSRASINQDMYAAPYALSRLRYAVLEPLIVGMDAWFRYRFHRYAERVGPGAGQNTQLDFGASFGVEYVPLASKEWGTVSVGADLGWGLAKRYPSGEEFVAVDERSSETFWAQDYSWDVYATYTPVKYATVVLGLEQAANVLKDGIVNVEPFHRDQTQFFVQLLARY